MARGKFTSPTLELQITPDLHDRAIRSASGGCLIADAIKAQYPNLSRVTVDMATIRVSDREEGQRYTYLTPPAAQHLLLGFDQGWPQLEAADSVVVRRAVHISPIIRAKKGSTSPEARAERRRERLGELEAKQASGEALNRGEKSVLTKLRQARSAPERPTTTGRPEVKVNPQTGSAVVYGGRTPVQGAAHPNLLRGRDRHFGAKLADPGLAFQEAVDAAVAARLATTDVGEAELAQP